MTGGTVNITEYYQRFKDIVEPGIPAVFESFPQSQFKRDPEHNETSVYPSVPRLLRLKEDLLRDHLTLEHHAPWNETLTTYESLIRTIDTVLHSMARLSRIQFCHKCSC